MTPAHTQSPHRFLAPIPPSTQRPKPKPQSGLRHGVNAQTPRNLPQTRKDSVDAKKITTARRFIIGASRVTSQPGGSGQPPQNTHRAWPPRTLQQKDSIDESSPSSSANAEAQDGEDVMQSEEQRSASPTDNFAQEEQDSDDEILFITDERHKRRRIASAGPPSSPSQHPRPARPAQQHQQQPPQTPVPPSHRFRVPPPRTPAPFAASSMTPTTASTTTANKPHFILPRQSPSPSKSSTPLPETFSPSRKNGKYIPSGLASTLQGWIIETANAGYAARSNASAGAVRGREREDGVRLRVRVGDVWGGRKSAAEEDGAVECVSGGVVLVRGVRVDGRAGDEGEVRLLLAGMGGARGKGGVKIKQGSVLGVRAPMWNVDVGDGGKWLVGVEWVVCL